MRAQAENATQAANGNWSIDLVKYDGLPRYERMVGIERSQPVFETAREAFLGGNRAACMYNTTNRFPNLQERF